MKRRSFLAALAPIIALVAPSGAQTPPAAPAAPETAPKAKPAVPATPGGAAAQPATGAAAAAAGATTDKAKRSKGPTEITAMEAMLDNKANLAVFSGEVDVKSPDYTINSDKLTVYLKKSKPKAVDAKVPEPKAIGAEDVADKAADGGDKAADKDDGDNSGIDTAIAEGNVRILQIKPGVGNAPPQKYYGVGKKAVFDNAKQTCTLTGWPRVQQSMGGSLSKEIVSLEESCVIVMNNDRIDVRGGRHMTRIIDQNALGNGNAPANGAKGGVILGEPAAPAVPATPGAGAATPGAAGGASLFRGNVTPGTLEGPGAR